MNLTFSRDQLLSSLQTVIGVVERKQAVPILSNILLRITDKKMSVMGTDSEIELLNESPYLDTLAEPVALTLPGRKLLDICKALPDDSLITMTQSDHQQIQLKVGNSRFVLATLPADEFPSSDVIQPNLAFSISEQELYHLIHQTHFSMAQQDVRYFLNGMLLEIEDRSIRMVAADGHRLALGTLSLETPLNKSLNPSSDNNTATASSRSSMTNGRIQAILPRKTVLELMRTLTPSDTHIGIQLNHNQIQFSKPNFLMTSRLIEGKFPDYQQVIPRHCNKSITLEREILKQTLQRIAILCDEKYHGVRLYCENNQLQLSSNNPKQEIAEANLDIEYTNAPLDIGFNVTYLLDVLNAIDTETITLQFKQIENGILIEHHEASHHYAYVIMPMYL